MLERHGMRTGILQTMWKQAYDVFWRAWHLNIKNGARIYKGVAIT